MSPGIVQFATFELDRNLYELRCEGRTVKLERIPLDLLFLLVERRNYLVMREEIIQRIWGKGVFLDTDSAINSAVRKLRRALHDDSGTLRFVQTVPGKGYRFIAKVEMTAAHTVPLKDPYIPQEVRPIVVGREVELARAQSWSAQMIEGRRRVRFVAGEAGIGKTTFLTAFLDSLGASTRIGCGQCVEQYGAGEPYMPVLEAPAQVRAKLARANAVIVKRHRS